MVNILGLKERGLVIYSECNFYCNMTLSFKGAHVLAKSMFFFRGERLSSWFFSLGEKGLGSWI